MYQPLGYGPNGPLPPSQTLPTMYDLPSESAEDPGLPDLFHLSQPRLLDETLRSPAYPPDQRFAASDLNLYYDARHSLWYKRPDWFLVLGVAPAVNQAELRLSYVMWQETVAPFLVVELLSPGTADEDLGQTLREVNRPPSKWQVYEQILRVPYYAVFDRYESTFQLFSMRGMRYEELELKDERFWFEELELGLGVWAGTYAGTEGRWLRWYDAAGHWIVTQEERAEAERQRAEFEQPRAEFERQRAEQATAELAAERDRANHLAAKLRDLGIEED
ncbi:Uma2 family endonuclease [Lyngbya confervoides]|uniref:Uma2 family endonuclease n=1 Tax=Lyngbya confervoides BDU141951 TaxID=1574623 RepID=A0ABD4SY04_9CYAN|nr:Uma2 family endonuclease [Lyngbya confervoides]MCM1981239.1 Uma2 family endonuclease [Lyngbya confervoides BDU141951]